MSLNLSRTGDDHLKILLDFGDCVRSLAEPDDVMAAALEVVGRHLGAARSTYSEIDAGQDYVTVKGTWTDGRLGNLTRHPMSDFGPFFLTELEAGRIVASGDLQTDRRIAYGSVSAFAAIGVRALLSVPLIRQGRLSATLCLHDVVPREWTSEEVVLAQEIAERTWNAVERARFEWALQESETRLRTLSDTMPQLIWTSLAIGQVDWTGPQWRAYSGLSDAESYDHGWLVVVHPDDRPGLIAAWFRASGEGRAGNLDIDIRLRRHDGAWRWFQTIAAPLPLRHGARTAVRQWLGTCTDVDALKCTEQRLRESETRFRTMADAMPPIVWTATPDGTHDYYNRRWYEFTGLSRDLGIGEGWIAAMHPDDLQRTQAHWQYCVRMGENYEIEHRHRGKDGAYRWFMGRGLPIREAPTAEHPDGRIERWFGTCTDIQELVEAREMLTRGRDELEALVAERTAALTRAVDDLNKEATERTQAEERLRQSQKMEAIGQLTGGIAHDFNNMLQGIGTGLELMQSRVEQGRADEIGSYLEAARQSVDRAGALTHRLLTFARRQTLDPRPINADALVAGMSELIRRTVGPAIRTDFRMCDGNWRVVCDVNQLENALLNLVINARDAMPGGGQLVIGTYDVCLGAADVAGQGEAEPGDFVEISVSDTGMGITPDILERAFEPFFTTKPIGQGTGLGLSQVYGFARQSGSVLRIESKIAQGTTVTLCLPRHAQVPASLPEPPAVDKPKAAGTGETVLLVEDDAIVRELIVERLREMDYKVLEAADGRSALRVLDKAGAIDLLVTDVGLPEGLNGRQVAEIAREQRPGLPILFITGYAGSSLDDQLSPGMAVIIKPFTLNALTNKIHTLIVTETADASD